MSSALLIVAGVAGLLIGADLLVRGGAALASLLGIWRSTAASAGWAGPACALPAWRNRRRVLVDGSIEIARSRDRSEATIGLTVIAIGTSAPELVTTLTATIRGDRDIAVGNLLGSSVYNIALILGNHGPGGAIRTRRDGIGAQWAQTGVRRRSPASEKRAVRT